MLGIVSLFTDASSEMIYPLVPLFVSALGSGAVVLGIIEGVAETTASVLKLVSGVVSDRLGKRKLLVAIGYILSSAVRPFTGLVGSAWQIVFVRMIDRVGKGVRTAPRDALIASSIDDNIRGRAYGFHRAMDHTGAMIGPLLAILALVLLVVGAGMTDTLLALRWTFVLAAVPGACAVVTLVVFVRERVEAAGKPFSFSVKRFDRNFLRYLSIVVLFTLGNSSDAFLLFRVGEVIRTNDAVFSTILSTALVGPMVRQFGDLATQKTLVNILLVPLVWSFFHIIKAVLSTPFGSLSDRIGRKLVINIGWGIYALVYLCFAVLDLVPAPWQVAATFVLFAIYALYYALTEGVEKAFVADLVKSDERGSAFGMYNFAVGLGALPASIVFGLLYNAFGATAAFGTGASLAFLSMLFLQILVREPPKQASSQDATRLQR